MTIMLEERIVTATGVERRTSAEPAGTDRVAANPAAYAPTAGIRLVLVLGGDR